MDGEITDPLLFCLCVFLVIFFTSNPLAFFVCGGVWLILGLIGAVLQIIAAVPEFRKDIEEFKSNRDYVGVMMSLIIQIIISVGCLVLGPFAGYFILKDGIKELREPTQQVAKPAG